MWEQVRASWFWLWWTLLKLMKLFLDRKELFQVIFSFVLYFWIAHAACVKNSSPHICTYLNLEKFFNDQALVCNTAAAKGTLVIVCSTVAPAYIQNLEKRLTGKWLDMFCDHWFSEMQVIFCVVVMIPTKLAWHADVMRVWRKIVVCAFEESNISLVDAPISGGAVKAAAGTLTVDFYSSTAYKY